MSTYQNSFWDWMYAPFLPIEAMTHLSGFQRTARNGGCKSACEYARTDDSRLPWSTNGEYGGWGGAAHHGTLSGATHLPIIFVHGNQRDACDWEGHAAAFRNRGISGDSMWAITFGQGTPTHAEMATQLDQFVAQVRDHTDADQVVLVAHSLGVTGVRYWLEACDRYEWVHTVVGLAGANHGVDFATVCCNLGMTDGPFRVSHFLRTDYDSFEGHPLSELNGEETPGDIDYFTIRGAFDELFWMNRDSPMLEGAEENVSLPTDHDGVREDEEAMDLIYEWAAVPLNPPNSVDS